jgi:hypothetical protein
MSSNGSATGWRTGSGPKKKTPKEKGNGAKDMNTQEKMDKIRELMETLSEVGIYNAVLAFEMPTAEGLTPHLIKHGSPMACLALTEWSASFQHDEAYEGLEVSIWYDDEDEEDGAI